MTAARIIPFIVATIFMDAVGFGIIMPVLPQLVMEVGRIDLPRAIEVGAWIGLVMAVATFLASPVLGNLSDHFGRRRVSRVGDRDGRKHWLCIRRSRAGR